MKESIFKDHVFDWNEKHKNYVVCKNCKALFEILPKEKQGDFIDEDDQYAIEFLSCQECMLHNII